MTALTTIGAGVVLTLAIFGALVLARFAWRMARRERLRRWWRQEMEQGYKQQPGGKGEKTQNER